MKKPDKVHGEGNYAASKQFDDAQKAFVQSGKAEQAARNIAPKSKAEEDELNRAEQTAKARSKEEDPAVLRRASGTSKKR